MGILFRVVWWWLVGFVPCRLFFCCCLFCRCGVTYDDDLTPFRPFVLEILLGTKPHDETGFHFLGPPKKSYTHSTRRESTEFHPVVRWGLRRMGTTSDVGARNFGASNRNSSLWIGWVGLGTIIICPRSCSFCV
jgi:hypothetical protein